MVVPTETAVTSPVPLIVATATLDDTHGLVAAAATDPVSCEVSPRQTASEPLIVGSGLTVNSTER